MALVCAVFQNPQYSDAAHFQWQITLEWRGDEQTASSGTGGSGVNLCATE
jgi:hypothetical protein